MKKREFKGKVSDVIRYPWNSSRREKIMGIVKAFDDRVSGKKGAEDARDRFFTIIRKMQARPNDEFVSIYTAADLQRHKENRRSRFLRNSAEELAAAAGVVSDEHGSWTGDHLAVTGLDFVLPHKSAPAPYCDMGGEGLGLVKVTRTRVYAGSKWRPSEVSTTFLVGRNEVGTYFSHPVSPACGSVLSALQWMWGGKAERIIQRQGDIALVFGKGPKLPALPRGHKVDTEMGCIVHETHPALPLPEKGQRIIVARRAAERASEATRD